MVAKISKIIVMILVVLVIAFIGFQIYQSYYSPLQTETVFSTTVNHAFDSKGIVVRNETVLPDEKQGAVSYEINNGDKVAKNSVLAVMYPSEQDIVNLNKIERLEAELKTVQDSQTEGAVASGQIDVLSSQIDTECLGFLTMLQSQDLTDLYDVKNNFVSMFNRKQLILGTATDFNNRINELTNQINQLKSSSGQPITTVTSSASGYFVNSVDGYESLVNLDNIQTASLEQIYQWVNDTSISGNPQQVGKIITDSVWQYAAIMDKDDAALLKKGMTRNLQFSDLSDQLIPAEIVSINLNASATESLVIFESDVLSNSITQLRVEDAQVVIGTYEGIKIPKQALRVVDNEKGVYIKFGQEVRFKKVDILYEDEEYFISKDNPSDSSLVRSYDDVIVKGVDLYDGKQIH